MKVLDLFSGLGGFSVGFDKAGMETIAFCEIDPECQVKLKKLWPGVPVYSDVKELINGRLKSDGIGPIDVICGGFPCQDLSQAGNQAGIQGERSGLYKYMLSIVSEYKPGFVVFENVTALLSGDGGRWFSKFLNDLAAIGYDAQWHSIPASSVGALHHRDRVWIIAYPSKELWDGAAKIYNAIASQIAECRTSSEDMALLAEINGLQFKGDEPDHRKLDGILEESHAHGALGNSVHTKITEIIGRAIMEVDR